ncbi:hypothetical protein ACFYU9_05145 [Streptomyces sp. NPDC004327]|uniref:hypothetical protein n=1 Tax=Streptomyces sp. NPDC004327 TaxID=3364699 RepID=UPI0036C89E38
MATTQVATLFDAEIENSPGSPGVLLSVEDLEWAVPQLVDFRSPVAREIDWQYIQGEIGVALPQDFMELSDWYPSFAVDEFLSVHIPDPGMEQYFVRGVRGQLEVLSRLRDTGRSLGYVPFPESSGLFPWGDSIDGDYFYWRTGVLESEPWTILVRGANDDWCEYNGSLTEYLAGLVRGTVPPEGLPPDFPGPAPVIDVD